MNEPTSASVGERGRKSKRQKLGISNRSPEVYTRLTEADNLKFEALCRSRGLAKTELAREALLAYLDVQEKKVIDERETLLEKRMRKMEDRMAKLLVRLGIDVGVVYQVIYRNLPADTRDKAFAFAYQASTKRLRQKMDAHEQDMVETFSRASESEKK